MLVTIDGPAGAGKSTVARALARALGVPLLDTGAIYRTLALVARERGIAWDDERGLAEVAGDFPIEFGPLPQDPAAPQAVTFAGADVTARIRTPGRGLVEITGQVRALVPESGITRGLLTLFARHTSASLLVQENADPDVRGDLERFFTRLVPDGDPLFRHRDEGDDDMPAHVRSALTAVQLAVPIRMLVTCSRRPWPFRTADARRGGRPGSSLRWG